MSKKHNYKRKFTTVEKPSTQDKSQEALDLFLSGKTSPPPPVRTDKQEKRLKVLSKIFVVLMLASAGIWLVFFNIAAGVSMVISEGELHRYGIPMLAETGIILIGVTLCFLSKRKKSMGKYNLPSLAVSLIGLFALLVTVNNMCAIVDGLAKSDENFRMLSDVYKLQHYPSAVAVVFQTIIVAINFFGYEETRLRNEKRRKRIEARFAEAPKIIDDNDE